MVSQVQQRTYTRVTRFVLARLSLLPKKLVDFLLWRRRYRDGHGHGPGVIVVNVVVGIVGVVGAVGVTVVVVALQACQLRIHHAVLMCGTGITNASHRVSREMVVAAPGSAAPAASGVFGRNKSHRQRHTSDVESSVKRGHQVRFGSVQRRGAKCAVAMDVMEGKSTWLTLCKHWWPTKIEIQGSRRAAPRLSLSV